MDIAIHMHHGGIERQRVIHDTLQFLGRDILTEESIGHLIGNLLKTHLCNAVEKLFRQLLYTFGHIQPLVCGKATYHRFLKRGQRCLLIGAIVVHNVSILYLLLIFLPVCVFRAVSISVIQYAKVILFPYFTMHYDRFLNILVTFCRYAVNNRRACTKHMEIL